MFVALLHFAQCIFLYLKNYEKMAVFYVIGYTKIKLGATALFALDTLLYM